MTRSTDTTSFSEHRRRLRDHLEQVRRTGRPLFIMSNGEPDAVVMSPEAYDALADKAELLESRMQIDRSVADVREGRTTPAKASIEKLASTLRLKLER
jgi:prevent-host-death family protein